MHSVQDFLTKLFGIFGEINVSKIEICINLYNNHFKVVTLSILLNKYKSIIYAICDNLIWMSHIFLQFPQNFLLVAQWLEHWSASLVAHDRLVLLVEQRY